MQSLKFNFFSHFFNFVTPKKLGSFTFLMWFLTYYIFNAQDRNHCGIILLMAQGPNDWEALEV